MAVKVLQRPAQDLVVANGGGRRHVTLLGWPGYLVAISLGLVLGVLATSGKLTVILLVLGGAFGLFMLTQPVPLLFAVTLVTLVFSGLAVYYFPDFAKIRWTGFILAAALIVPSVAASLSTSGRGTGDRDIRLALPAGIFLLCAIVSSVYYSVPVQQLVDGVKTLFLYTGVWLALAFLPLTSETIQRLLKVLLGIGLIQWLIAIPQFLIAKTTRVDADKASAADAVVGSFGGRAEGGGLTAVLAMYLVILAVAVLSLYRRRLISKRQATIMIFLLSLPMVVMEVKALFVYLPVALLLLYRAELVKSPGKLIMGGLIGVLLVGGGLLAYQALHWSSVSDDLLTSAKKSFGYSFEESMGGHKYEAGMMTRREALEFWWKEHRLSEPLSFFFGHGVSSSKTGSTPEGVVAQRYGLDLDTTGMSTLLWDTGLLGTGSVMALLGLAFLRASALARSQTLLPWQVSVAETLQVAFVLFTLSLPYRHDIPYAAPTYFMVMLSLGLVQWLAKQERLNRSHG